MELQLELTQNGLPDCSTVSLRMSQAKVGGQLDLLVHCMTHTFSVG